MSDKKAPSLLEAVKARSVKRGQTAHSFESLKPVLEVMIKGDPLLDYAKRVGANYQTLNKRKIAALEFLDPNNTKRVMSAEDAAWVKHRLENTTKKEKANKK
jgi:hypothetical protein